MRIHATSHATAHASTHLVAIVGFSDFERETLASFFRLHTSSSTRYRLVRTLENSEILLVDADSPAALAVVQRCGRASDSICIGRSAGFIGALAHLDRPIDALQVKKTLDRLTLREPDTVALLPPFPDTVEMPLTSLPARTRGFSAGPTWR
jgi:hypothetical protein